MVLEWQDIQEQLKQGLSRGQYDLWVATLDFLRIENDVFVLGCKNWLHVDWVRDRLETKLLAMAQQKFPQLKQIKYEISPPDLGTEIEVDTDPGRSPGSPRQVTFGDIIGSPKTKFNPRFTFDRFVVGQCNQFAYATSMAVAANPSYYNQSIYLLADPGLGKSHLAHAVGNQLGKQQPGMSVRYVTAEQFTNEMISSLKNDRMEAFKRKYREDCDVLLLEKVEFFSGKSKIQNELMFTMDELLDRGKRIVCTGNASPKDIPRLNNELRSRLSGVLVAPIDHPDFDTRVAIIRRKAHYDNIQMPDEVVEFLAHGVSGDIRQLESCIVGVVAKSSILEVPISMGLAREVVQTMLDYLPKLSCEHIVQAVCNGFQVGADELRSPGRCKRLATARHVGMYLCRKYTSESLTSIGKVFGRSHSSVVYALKRMDSELGSKTSKVKRQLQHIGQRLETRCLF